MENMPSYVFAIEGEKADAKSLIALDYPDIESTMPPNIMKSGDFGATRKEIAEATGADTYNVEILWYGTYKMEGVVNETGTEICTWDVVSKQVDTMKWLSPEKLEELKEERDDVNTPSCPHITPTPEKKGKIYWISGPPGAGKSTTCQLLGRKQGFVYYEADAMLSFINPYIPLDVDNPSNAQKYQKALKGVSREDFEILTGTAKFFEAMHKGEVDGFDEAMQPLLKLMSREIIKQKKRLGGDFAVAHAVVSRRSRDLCRSLLGPDAVFIVLNLTKSCVRKRLQARHGEGDENADKFTEVLHKMYDLYEPAGEDEEGAHNITITEDMSTDDVMKLVLEKIGC